MSNQSLKRKLDPPNESVSLPTRSELLNAKLARRPDRHQLIEQGILRDSHCAPSLQNAEHALKRARLADELNDRLSNRPGPLDLVHDNILHIDTQDPNLEQAIQGGQIPFKTNGTSRRPLVFHEYTGPPSLCKPKVTKVDSLSSSSTAHEIRLAQQQLLLELTTNKEEERPSLVNNKSLEQMTLVELREVCKRYQVPSSHGNKSKLIERIKQAQEKIDNNNQEFSVIINDPNLPSLNDGSSYFLAPSTTNVVEQQEEQPLLTLTIEDILMSMSVTSTDQEQEQPSSLPVDFDLQWPLIDPSTVPVDDNCLFDEMFIQMLLDNDPSSTTETSFDDLFLSDLDLSSIPSNPTTVTNLDEFDAFFREFTLNLPTHPQELSPAIS